jgi:REP element-mobilizing transposase RayT
LNIQALSRVMARGNRGQEIVRDYEDCETFLQSLGKTCGKTGWHIHACVLMPDHYHLLLATEEAKLSFF